MTSHMVILASLAQTQPVKMGEKLDLTENNSCAQIYMPKNTFPTWIGRLLMMIDWLYADD